LLALIFILIAMVCTFIISRHLTIPIRQMKTQMQAVASGNLTVEMDSSTNNEVGELAESINSVLRAFRNVIISIRETSNTLSDNTNEMAALMEQSTHNVHVTADAMTEIEEGAVTQVSAVQSLKASADVISSHVHIANTTVRTLHAKAKTTQQKVDDGYEQMQHLLQQNESSSDNILKMRHFVLKLEDKIHLIRNVAYKITIISEQTQMLAMNAGLEAAHAQQRNGSQALTVLANEIRNLSVRSKEATRQIDVTLKQMRDYSRHMKKWFDTAETEIEKQTHEVSQTEVAFHEQQHFIQEAIASIDLMNAQLLAIANGKDHWYHSLSQITNVCEQAEHRTFEVNAMLNENVEDISILQSSSEKIHIETIELLKQIEYFNVEHTKKNVNYSNTFQSRLAIE
ncbi:MAG: methyl-accepting chemotaxis protein, partial [Bacilli bacterium]